jgi:thiazole synthase
MEDVFNEFEEVIQTGLKNNMPRDAKLIAVGQIIYAVTRDELTNKEGWRLEEMLGGRTQWEDALEYSIFGYPVDTATPPFDKPLIIAGKTFHSRLMTGTGKYRSIAEMQQSVNASRCEIVTVAVRRVQTNAPGHEGLAQALDWTKIWMLPNTAGCQTADEAIRVARLGREMAKLLGQEDNNFVKLEVIPDAKYLLPDPIGTLEAATQLVKEGFAVLPYINADPLLAKRLEEVGCATVMPLGSPIGSGQGINNAANIKIIIDTVKIPVVVDAGIGTPSEAAQAMEMGADALLINSAIANAQNSPAMAKAMGMAAEAGRLAYLAGRMPVKDYAIASSPETGTIASK